MNGKSKGTLGVWKYGDKVWYKDKSSLESAWDQPKLFTVVAENEGVVWVKDELEDKLVFSHELTPFTEEGEKKKATLASLSTLLRQTTLSKEEIREVREILLEAGGHFRYEEKE